MVSLKLAICDDEHSSLLEYRSMLELIFKKHDINVQIELFYNCKELMFAMEDEKDEIDLVFLDINMPEMNGIEMAHWIRENQFRCDIIFLTASQIHMFDAFDVGALHYIVKGITKAEKIEEICLKAADIISKRKNEFVTVTCAGESRVVSVPNILYFEVQNYIIVIHYENESFEFYSTLGKIENALAGRGFVRAHRSYLVNVGHIKSLSRQEMLLTNGESIPVGRKYVEEIRQYIQVYSSASMGNTNQAPPSHRSTVPGEA